MEKENKESTDEELIIAIVSGNHEPFAQLVRRHARRFYSLAYRILSNREEAEDIVQESFLLLWESPDKWDSSEETRFTTWFYKIILNRCLDRKKKAKETSISLDHQILDESRDAETIISMTRMREQVEKDIKDLPQSQQIALNLCFYEGIKNKDAAEIMGISIKALESLLMRAKYTLRSKLKSVNNIKEVV